MAQTNAPLPVLTVNIVHALRRLGQAIDAHGGPWGLFSRITEAMFAAALKVHPNIILITVHVLHVVCTHLG